MSCENFKCVGPGETLAYLRRDLRQAQSSVLIIGPWLDDYFAEAVAEASPNALSARILVRPSEQADSETWGLTLAALSIFTGHWATCECRSLGFLHAKCLQIDERIVYIGSTNWYLFSLESSMEIMLRGPLGLIEGGGAPLESLWDQGEPVSGLAKAPVVKARPAQGITHEVLDPLAAEVLKRVKSAFIIGKKR